jgi:hypothetical protein
MLVNNAGVGSVASILQADVERSSINCLRTPPPARPDFMEFSRPN